MATLLEVGICGLVLLTTGISVSFVVEQLLRPRPHLRSRYAPAYAVHAGVWLLVFGVALAVWQRPLFGTGLVTAGMLLVVLVSNAKFASLREPFLLSDFRFFSALLRHPRLYLPFFGVLPAIGCAIGFIALCVLAVRIESSLAAKMGVIPFVFACLMIVSVGAALMWVGALKHRPVTLDPGRDLQSFGLIGSLVRYWQEEGANDPQRVAEKLSGLQVQPRASRSQQDAHIVAVQCESFFDARRVFPGVNAEVLKNFDALGKSASQAGRLNVPAWGANTVRTEFAFLSGVAPAALGVHQFNPYRKLARFGVPTIASELKKQGYRTICVHPFSAKFYDRDKVFPALGFDEFIDIAAFVSADRSGPYIGDAAVAKKVSELLAVATVPLFVFVITMENHGPLHQERAAEGDQARLYVDTPPDGYDEFTVYLRHLQHTDAMLGTIYDALQATSRRGWLCAYGDHVPILSGVYDASAFTDGRTDYLIVGRSTDNIVGHKANIVDIAPEELAASLLNTAGYHLAKK